SSSTISPVTWRPPQQHQRLLVSEVRVGAVERTTHHVACDNRSVCVGFANSAHLVGEELGIPIRHVQANEWYIHTLQDPADHIKILIACACADCYVHQRLWMSLGERKPLRCNPVKKNG